jgi:parvulin-like peptidyl-prolyl isomerase
VRLFLFLILACVTISCGAKVRAAAPPDWGDLSSNQQTLWEAALSAGGRTDSDPEGTYRAYARLAAESPDPRDADTRQRALRLATREAASAVLWRRLLAAVPEPTEAQLTDFLAGRSGDFEARERVDLQSIYLRRFEGEAMDAVRTRAAEVAFLLEQGTDFAEVATLHSDATSRAIRGSAGTITTGALPPDLEQIIFGLAENETAGPIERPKGIYFFRVTRKYPGFSLTNPVDRAKTVEGWKILQAGPELRAMEERFAAAHKIESPAPISGAEWLNDPWLVVDDTTEGTYRDFLILDRRHDPPPAADAQWGDGMAEEAGIAVRSHLSQVAALDSVGADDPDIVALVPLLLTLDHGRAVFAAWGRTLKPTDEETAAYYELNAPVMDPLTPRYTALLWLWQPDMAGAEGPRLIEARNANLAAVHKAANDAGTPKAEDEATALLATLSARFPGSRTSRLTAAEYFGPAVDPILYRTQPGELSRPFDDENAVGLVYMIERSEARIGLEAARPGVIESWRNEQMERRLQELSRP